MLISHLLFAHDTLMFYKDSKEQFSNLSFILLWLEVVSRLNINLEKSSMLAVGCAEDLEGLTLILGCKVEGLTT